MRSLEENYACSFKQQFLCPAMKWPGHIVLVMFVIPSRYVYNYANRLFYVDLGIVT